MYKTILTVIVLTLVLVFCSCTRDELPPSIGNCAPTLPSYDNEMRDVVNQTCAYSGCHDGGNPGIGNYKTYNGILPFLNNDKVDTRTILQRDMPPVYATGPTTLTQEQLDLFICWKENEYKE